MQGVVALGVFDVRVCTVGDEELNDIEVAAAGGPLHGCCDEVAAEGIDFGALFKEEATGGDLGIYSGPVERGYAL